MCADQIRISLVQNCVEWLQPQKNRVAADGWIAKCSDSRLVILPEMFTSGFCTNPSECAEESGETLRWMAEMARKYDIAIAGSVATEERGKFYNRLYVVMRNGEYVKYDKRHLFSFGGEDKSYSAGRERVVVEIDGVRILLLICYDLRFPVWSRNRGDYDVMMCVANWPSARREVWDTLLRARAIENLCYVCGVNIVGEDPTARYSGGTSAIDYRGRLIASVADEEQGIVSFEVDMKSLKAFRDKFPALDDADNFELR